MTEIPTDARAAAGAPWRPARGGLRATLRARKSMLATFLLLPRVEVVEMIAIAGFDAVIIDLEHGPTSDSELMALISAAQGAGLFAVVRVADGADAEIGRTLDFGVDGLLVPHVTSAAQAERIARAGRFPPAGDRSINPYVRSNAYGADGAETYASVNADVALIAMVEGAEALTALEQIAATPELDGIFIGPVDLSSSLGFPDQPEHPQVVDAVRDVCRLIGATGLAAGVYSPTPAAAARWLAAGAQFVALSADSALMMRSLHEYVSEARQLTAVVGAHDGDGSDRGR
jgi:2-keto-3-deoxy-L-rhamnonate aldolase RhmA